MNEQALVAAIRDICAVTLHPRILHGIGDDCAVWQPSRSHRSVVSTDALIEGRHFRRETASAGDIGHRALAANLSDLAAMGATPVLATVALGLSDGVDESWVREFYAALAGLAVEHRVAVVGGDLVRTPVVTISITVVGEVSAKRLTLRSGARVHDVLAVTGTLGASYAGLRLLQDPDLISRLDARRGGSDRIDAKHRERLLAAHLRPRARIREGRFLAASQHVHAMMDVSDGLSTDLHRLCAASKIGAVMTNVPVNLAVMHVAVALEEDAETWALDGGEDFELLVAVERRAFTHLALRFKQHLGRDLIAVGVCTADGTVAIERDGIRGPLPAKGWDAFRG